MLRATIACTFSPSQLPELLRPRVFCVPFDLEMCFVPQRRALFRHLNFQKCSDPGVFVYLLIWKCASCHNGAHFFDISTSKSAPTLVCFVHFGLEMCFVPQWRALFRHLNFQKCSDPGVFCTFWLGNVLRATTVCSQSCLTLVCFVHFDLEMCLTPQWRAAFHLSYDHMAPHPPL